MIKYIPRLLLACIILFIIATSLIWIIIILAGVTKNDLTSIQKSPSFDCAAVP